MKPHPMHSRLTRLAHLAVLLGPGLYGCATVHTRTLDQGDVNMTEAEFAAQVERVFRYHNKIMNELIAGLPSLSDDEETDSELSDAEEDMNEACEPLNEVISDESVFRSSSFWTKRKLPEAVPECEEATLRVETLLRHPFAAGRGVRIVPNPVPESANPGRNGK